MTALKKNNEPTAMTRNTTTTMMTMRIVLSTPEP